MPTESAHEKHARKKEKRKKREQSQRFSTPPVPPPSSSGDGEEGDNCQAAGRGNAHVAKDDLSSAAEEEKKCSASKESSRRKTSQPWVRGEDDVILRHLCRAGERNVDWNAVLGEINRDRDVERSMKSLRLHWSNTLRKHIMKMGEDHGAATSPRQSKTFGGVSSTECTPTKKKARKSRIDENSKPYVDDSEADEF